MPGNIPKEELMSSFPPTPALLWGHLAPRMTLKLISEARFRVLSEPMHCEKVRYTLPIRTLGEACLKVRPICLPVEYSRRHLPGRSSSQSCLSIHVTSIYLGFRIVVVNKARYTIQKLLDGLSNIMVAQIIVWHCQIVRRERPVNAQCLYEDNAL